MGVISWAAQAFGPVVVAAAIVVALAVAWWLSRRDARAEKRRSIAGRRDEAPR